MQLTSTQITLIFSSDSEEDPQNEHLSENEVRESVRQSFKRDFMSSEHLGDAETEALQVAAQNFILETQLFRLN